MAKDTVEDRLKKFEIWKERCNIKFKNKYDYSKFVYVNLITKGIIICPEHGEFQQTPHNHLASISGCKQCSKHPSYTEEDIKIMIKEIVKEDLDFSEFKYVKKDVPVTLICKKHGRFQRTVYGIEKGSGCPDCQREREKNNFFNKAREIHGDKYIYHEDEYKSLVIPIRVTCPEHGDFYIQPANHIYAKQGCVKCKYPNRVFNTETFIAMSKKIHGEETYDYSKTNYTKSRIPLTLTCPKHGDFDIFPQHHLKGFGCIKCRKEKRKKATS